MQALHIEAYAMEDGSYRSKVARVKSSYDIDMDLAARWTGESGERWSLRDLADAFNRRVLETVLSANGVMASQSDVDHIYRVLSGGSGEGDKVQKRRELEREGVDVDELLGDFVSHQAMHSYLTKTQQASFTGQDSADQIENAIESINRLVNRTKAVSENTVDRLARTERIEVGAVEVYVDARAYCVECGTELPVTELLQQGGCQCNTE